MWSTRASCRRPAAAVRICPAPCVHTVPRAHTGYILFQFLKLIGREAHAEEFNTLPGAAFGDTKKKSRTAPPKTLELAITNDRIWAKVCQALGWRFHPTV